MTMAMMESKLDTPPDVYSQVQLPPPSPILPGERSFLKGLFPLCFQKQTGGGVEESSSDSEETLSLKEVEATLAKEEEAAKQKYLKLKRQRRSLLDVLTRKKRHKGKNVTLNYYMLQTAT